MKTNSDFNLNTNMQLFTKLFYTQTNLLIKMITTLKKILNRKQLEK